VSDPADDSAEDTRLHVETELQRNIPPHNNETEYSICTLKKHRSSALTLEFARARILIPGFVAVYSSCHSAAHHHSENSTWQINPTKSLESQLQGPGSNQLGRRSRQASLDAADVSDVQSDSSPVTHLLILSVETTLALDAESLAEPLSLVFELPTHWHWTKPSHYPPTLPDQGVQFSQTFNVRGKEITLSGCVHPINRSSTARSKPPAGKRTRKPAKKSSRAAAADIKCHGINLTPINHQCNVALIGSLAHVQPFSKPPMEYLLILQFPATKVSYKLVALSDEKRHHEVYSRYYLSVTISFANGFRHTSYPCFTSRIFV